MATESSSSKSSSASADSYIGSLISLTSKSEIRYEGILYNINTEESSIGLRNVRSFGTEGRNKNGPQVLPSDKIYEYILFRGSDIKDLQVKSSPPVQTTPSVNIDPAIIQSHYPRPASASASLHAAAGGSLPNLSSQTAQLSRHASTIQGGLPLYQPGGNLGSWGPSPAPPTANGGGLAMPMYWQGYYGPPNVLPHLHQQSLLRPPPGLSMPPSMQQPIPYSGFNASLPTGSSTLPGSNFPEYPSSLVPNSATSINLPTTLNLPTSLPALTVSSSLSSVKLVNITSETLPTSALDKTPAIPVTPLSSPLPSRSISTISSCDVNLVVPANSNKLSAISVPSLPYQTISQPISTASLGTSSQIQTETPTPSLVTPGQLLLSAPAAVSTPDSSQTVNKDVEVVQVSSTLSSERSAPVQNKAQPPILPLPTPARSTYMPDEGPSSGHYNNYRGRGTGTSRPVTRFTEDFDFNAMNEKFKKNEVWGHLGKSCKSHLKDEGDGEDSDEDDFHDEDEEEMPKIDVKPVYNKDDFFDSLSCNALDNQSNNGRRFSEQMKRDTETFGDYAKYRGGRGPFGGGRSRGSYYGRGYNYVGRGRGRGVPSRAS